MEADDLRSDHADQAETDFVSDRRLADRLDAIEAEQVIRRALELEAEALDAPHMFTAEQLERIADEIGVDAGFIRRAVGEVKLGKDDRRRLDRWILPEEIIETATISDVDRATTDETVAAWMTSYEGLRPGRQVEGTTEWDLDRRWARQLQSALNLGGNRISRVAGSDIAHRVYSTSESEHIVALLSKGIGPLLLAKTTALVSGLAFALTVIAAANNGLGGFLSSVAVGMVLCGAFASAGLFGARTWADRIRRAMRTSLTGLSQRARPGKRPRFSMRRKRPS